MFLRQQQLIELMKLIELIELIELKLIELITSNAAKKDFVSICKQTFEKRYS